MNELDKQLLVSSDLTEIADLLNRGANIDAGDKHNNTSLHIATMFGYTNIVKMLLDSGANIEAINDNNEKPLDIACKKGNLFIGKMLLDSGAELESPDDLKNIHLHGIKDGHCDCLKIVTKFMHRSK